MVKQKTIAEGWEYNSVVECSPSMFRACINHQHCKKKFCHPLLRLFLCFVTKQIWENIAFGLVKVSHMWGGRYTSTPQGKKLLPLGPFQI